MIDHNQLAKFMQFTQYSLLEANEQEACGHFPHLWLSDYWTLEVAKCLYLGDETYLSDPIPRRLINNPHFSQTTIISHANYKRSEYQHLAKIRKEQKVSELLIGEVGRGLDILVALSVGTWDKIYCYDHNDKYGELLNRFFGDIEFSKSSTLNYCLQCQNPFIMVLNHALINNVGLQRFQGPSLVSLLVNGEIYA